MPEVHAERQLCVGRRSAVGPGPHCRRRAPASSTFLVGVGWIMLELVVEAHVVHLLEHVVTVRFDRHRTTAPSTDRRIAHPSRLLDMALKCQSEICGWKTIVGFVRGVACLGDSSVAQASVVVAHRPPRPMR